MHELAITEQILNVVLNHAKRSNVKKIVSISLRIGEVSDLEDEWIQHYFSYLAKKSPAAKAKLKIERVPVVMSCNECEHRFQIDVKEMKEIQCPKCGGKKHSLVSGKEYYIENMEVN